MTIKIENVTLTPFAPRVVLYNRFNKCEVQWIPDAHQAPAPYILFIYSGKSTKVPQLTHLCLFFYLWRSGFTSKRSTVRDNGSPPSYWAYSIPIHYSRLGSIHIHQIQSQLSCKPVQLHKRSQANERNTGKQLKTAKATDPLRVRCMKVFDFS